MKKLTFGILLFLVFCLNISSQTHKEKGLNSINRASAEAYIGFLADDLLEGREAGKRGSFIAREYIRSLLKDMEIMPFNSDSYLQTFEAYAPERQIKSRYSVHTDSIIKYKNLTSHRELSLANILGCIEGKNSGEYIVIGAHYDHLGVDEMLAADKIYNGADDNASGVSAVLQIAKAFLESGSIPERSIIFAFWDGEELGLLGSEYFVSNFSSINKIKGYINLDMIGRNNDDSNPEHVVYFYTASYPLFGEWLKNDINTYNLLLKPVYKPWDNPIGGSDNASFAKRDIPVIWYHTDGHADYHQPGDHYDKINWDKLVDITKAAYLNAWNMVNLKNFTP